MEGDEWVEGGGVDGFKATEYISVNTVPRLVCIFCPTVCDQSLFETRKTRVTKRE